MTKPFILGLTGSIGMGKTTASQFFADLGCGIWNADAAVHRMYSPGGAAVDAIGGMKPSVLVDGAVSRERLKDWIVSDAKAMARIEAIVHPLVAMDRADFIENAPVDIVVLDMPLLFETGADSQMDAIACVSTSPENQRKRVLARGTMDEAMFETILGKQLPDAVKRSRADYIIPTDTLDGARAAVEEIVDKIRSLAMRELVLDTETHRVQPEDGDRIVEIGAVELLNHMPTGNTYHQYINPMRDLPQSAFEVHGLSSEFLSDKPVFADIAQDFLDFVKGDKMVIHNAAFDMKFLNAELGWVNKPTLPWEQALDTLAIARKRFPGSPASLDALCRRFGIDNSSRTLHGALLDSEILAEVYLELIGGRQPDFGLGANAAQSSQSGDTGAWRPSRRKTPLASKLTPEEKDAHAAFIDGMGDEALWKKL